MSRDRAVVLDQLTHFFKESLLSNEQTGELTPQTSLRELGVLNSVGMAHLLSFIRGTLGAPVPVRALTGENFQTLEEITNLVISVREQAQ